MATGGGTGISTRKRITITEVRNEVRPYCGSHNQWGKYNNNQSIYATSHIGAAKRKLVAQN